jgi:hypothetical protein
MLTSVDESVPLKEVVDISCFAPTNRDPNKNLCPFSFMWRKVIAPFAD